MTQFCLPGAICSTSGNDIDFLSMLGGKMNEKGLHLASLLAPKGGRKSSAKIDRTKNTNCP